jgi:hypothetical protein
VDTSKPLVPLPAAVHELQQRRLGLMQGRPLASASPQGRAVEAGIRAAAGALQAARDRLNELDAKAGDGDCGTTVRKRGQARNRRG